MELRRLSGQEEETLFSSLENGFGLGRKLFRGFEFLMNGKRKVFMVNPMAADYAARTKFVSISLPFARMDGVITAF